MLILLLTSDGHPFKFASALSGKRLPSEAEYRSHNKGDNRAAQSFLHGQHIAAEGRLPA